MKILLVNPPYMDTVPEDVYFSITGYTVPHLGLGYIASFLEKNGFDVTFIECMAQGISLDDIKKLLQENDFKLIGISIYDGNRHNAFRLLEYIRKNNIQSVICAGGYTATLGYESLLKSMKALQYCILGEGELTMLDLANAVKNNANCCTIPGIAYRDSSGRVMVTEKRELIRNLDMLPFPIRKFYPARGEATILSSRGCKNQCLYCAIHSFYGSNCGHKFRNRSAENIFAEIEHIFQENPSIQTIGFYDDNFLAATSENTKRIERLCSLIIQSDYHVNLEITACADDINRSLPLLSQLKRAGLKRVFVGIESFVDRQLKYYRKHATVEDNLRALDNLRKFDLEASVGFIPMDPYVTLDEIKLNFTLLAENNIKDLIGDYVQPFSFSSALIGVANTAFRKELEEKGMYVANERGYIFVHDEVERYYQALRKWQRILRTITNKLYLVLVAKEKNLSIYSILKEQLSALMTFDIEYVLNLCDNITKISDQDIDGYNRPWIQSLQMLESAFDNAYDELREVIEKEYAAF